MIRKFKKTDFIKMFYVILSSEIAQYNFYQFNLATYVS